MELMVKRERALNLLLLTIIKIRFSEENAALWNIQFDQRESKHIVTFC